MMETPRAARRRITVKSRRISFSVSAAVDSSRIRTLVSAAAALAISIIWR